MYQTEYARKYYIIGHFRGRTMWRITIKQLTEKNVGIREESILMFFIFRKGFDMVPQRSAWEIFKINALDMIHNYDHKK